jgi:hypothetical protein
MRIGMSEHGGRADDPDLRAAPPHTGTFQSGYITAATCADREGDSSARHDLQLPEWYPW